MRRIGCIVVAVMAGSGLSACQAVNLLQNLAVIQSGLQSIEQSERDRARLQKEAAISCNHLNMYNMSGHDIDCSPEAAPSPQ